MNSLTELISYPPGSSQFWPLIQQYFEDYGKRAWPFEVWEALLEQAVENGVAAVIVDDPAKPKGEQKIVEFAGPFGAALLERWRWLQESRALGLTPEQAEARFNERVDRFRAVERQRYADEINDRRRRIEQQMTARRGRYKSAGEAEI